MQLDTSDNQFESDITFVQLIKSANCTEANLKMESDIIIDVERSFILCSFHD